MKEYQPYINLLTLKNHCKYLMKSSALMILLYGFKIYYELLIPDNINLFLKVLLFHRVYLEFIYEYGIFVITCDIQTLDIVRYNLHVHG